ncbi:protein of unknown function [Nitratireductor aquimarinus]
MSLSLIENLDSPAGAYYLKSALALSKREC